MDEFLDDMDDEQVDDLLMPEEDETSSSQMYEHFRFVADKGQSLLRVDKFLVDRMMGATRNRIQLAAEAGCILVNDKPVKSNYRVKTFGCGFYRDGSPTPGTGDYPPKISL